MCAVALKRRTNRAVVAAVFGAKRAPFPAFIDPCDPILRNRAPDGSGWLHEIKIDGYRAQLHIHRGRVTIYSRSGYDWTGQFRQIAHATERLSAHELIIDGEATVYGSTGLPDFQALRRELAKKHSHRLVYLAFDLLYFDGYDLRGAPLIERKRALQRVLEKSPPKIVYVEHFEMDDGEAVYRHACKQPLLGKLHQTSSWLNRSWVAANQRCRLSSRGIGPTFTVGFFGSSAMRRLPRIS